MNKALGLCLTVLLLSGCGSDNKQQATYQGVMEKKNKDYIAQGMKHLQNSKVPEAIASFDKAIQQDPRNVNNYLILGQVYLRLKNVPRAVDSFLAATRVDPRNGEAFYLLSTSLALDGKIEDATKAAKRSVEIFVQQKDEEKFKQSLALLKSLTDPKDAVKTSNNVVSSNAVASPSSNAALMNYE